MSDLAFSVPQLSSEEACALLRVSAVTLWRYSTQGVLIRDGRRVVLRSLRIGGRRRYSAEWIEAFVAELNEPAAPAPETPRQLSARQTKRSAKTDAILRKAGIRR